MESPIYSNEFIETLLDNMADGVYFVDRERKITYWNKGAERITGYASNDVINRFCFDNILDHIDFEGNHLCTGFCPLIKAMENGTYHESEIFLHHKKGHRVPIVVRVNPIRNDKGKIVGAVEMFSDATSQMAVIQKIKTLEKAAFVDKLTGLPNRAYLENILQTSHENFQKNRWKYGIIFFDVDHFKNFNDQYGHDIGDKVLKLVANTVQHNARSFDTYGRWGGDEFIGIIPNIDTEGLNGLAERIRVLISKSKLHIPKQELEVTITVGATVVRAGDDVSNILKRADHNMYISKENGRNHVTCR